ncbi:MAG: RsmD family RNA methyltransferase, partial [Acetobacteraceae bacterium]
MAARRPASTRSAASAAPPAESGAPRVIPACQHFGSCGGCVAQHLPDPAYAAWKAAQVEAALRRAGFPAVPAAPLARTPPGTRRRMDLALRRVGATVAVGLHRARSEEVIDLLECPVLHPALFALFAPLRGLLPGFGGLRREGSAIANLLDSGPDLVLRTDAALTPRDRMGLTGFARENRLARVSWMGRDGVAEPIAILRPPTMTFGGVGVTVPPGAFLQASKEGEAAIVAAVLAGLPESLPGRARIADLYAGCGTLTFAVARRARVSAFEGDEAAVTALIAAARHAQDVRVEVRKRDLARQPLGPAELAAFAAVVLDPPHAGAVAQVQAIAAARVPLVIYVSCNPAALARDARVLAAAGYRADCVTVVDQFLWSARVESVAV